MNFNSQQQSYIVANFINDLGFSDLQSFCICLEAYNNLFIRLNIEDIGFQQLTGYIYIGLESGILIASRFGRTVIYMVYDEQNNEDMEFDTYFEALEFLQNQQQ